MDKLPNETLLSIFGHVNDMSPETMHQLAKVNHKSRGAANAIIYRDKDIQVYSREALHKESDKLQRNLDFLHNVQYLKIWGYMLEESEEKNLKSKAIPSGLERQHEAEFYSILDMPLIGSDKEPENDWKPLVSLIRKCENLKDLVWACENQLPQCLLEVMEDTHPNCRLHLRIFDFKSLKPPGFVDAYERKLIKSPLLYSMSARLHGYDIFDAFYEAVRAAPNLKHVSIMTYAVDKDFATDSSDADPETNKNWCEGFDPALNDLGKRSLSSLMLIFNMGEVMLNDLLKWSDCTELSKIRFLTLESVTDPGVLTYLKREVDFASLKDARYRFTSVRI